MSAGATSKTISSLNELDWDTIKAIVLVVLHDEFDKSDRRYVDLKRIVERVPMISTNRLRMSLDGLVAQDLVRQEMRQKTMTSSNALFGIVEKPQIIDVATDSYRLTQRGVDSAATIDSKELSWIVLPFHQVPLAVAPPIKDSWEPLAIERDAETTKAALVRTEQAIKTIEESNGYAAQEPEERAGILATLKAGFALLKDGLISRATLRSTLVLPFSHLMTKFANGSINEVCKHAIDALWKLLS
jgi:hypothetical protein